MGVSFSKELSEKKNGLFSLGLAEARRVLGGQCGSRGPNAARDLFAVSLKVLHPGRRAEAFHPTAPVGDRWGPRGEGAPEPGPAAGCCSVSTSPHD